LSARPAPALYTLSIKRHTLKPKRVIQIASIGTWAYEPLDGSLGPREAG